MESRPRAVGARVATALSVLVIGAAYGYVASDSGWAPGEHVHVVAAATILGTTLTAAAVGMRQPGRPLATWLFAAVAIAQVVSYAIIGDPDNHGGQAGWFDVANLLFILPPAFAAWAHRRLRGRHVGAGPRPVPWSLRVLVIAGSVPLVWAAVDQALAQRNSWPPISDPHHQGHWHTVSIALVLVLVVAGLAARGVDGWPALAIVAAIAVGALGLTGLGFGSDASSPGAAASSAAVAWAVAVAAATVADRAGRRAEVAEPVGA